MKKVFVYFLLLVLALNGVYADDTKKDIELIDNFYIYDGSLDYIPMRQITENYSSCSLHLC